MHQQPSTCDSNSSFFTVFGLLTYMVYIYMYTVVLTRFDNIAILKKNYIIGDYDFFQDTQAFFLCAYKI